MPELEEAIARDPDDLAPYLVYADWLLAQGDPRGELILVQDELLRTTDAERQATLRVREQAILDKHLLEWMGAEVRGPRIKLSWRRGFLDELILDYREADITGQARLLRSPLCRLVRRIDLATHVSAGLDLLLAAPALRHLETLNLGSYRWAQFSTRGIAAAFPGLQHLDCDADSADLVDLRFGELRSLGIALTGLTLENFDAIVAADLPQLTSLLIFGGYMRDPDPARVAANEDDSDDDDNRVWFPAARCRRLLEAHEVPLLRELYFDRSHFGDELIDAMIGSPLLRQLQRLSLDDDELSAAGYQRLLDHSAAFLHLERLKLDGRAATAGMKALLSAALGPILVW